MHQLQYYHLLLRFPGAKTFINDCYIHNNIRDLYDFLIDVEFGNGLSDA